ncbi:MAG: transcriptional regulator [Rhodoferax ferrireducens]|uniref:Transcriptional regulator n=1 Tax=Rhodoferax ferrireducens TaxID=192843 RepID=A0A1W9KQ17_9BURK|nr:MAG: transcriptional regulator [Rhodoferax ferrireducens]
MTLDSFNEEEYRKRLIAGGIDAASAAEVAAKTAASRKASSLVHTAAVTAATLLQLPEPAPAPAPESLPPQTTAAPSPSASDEYWAKVYGHYQQDQAKKASAGPTQPTRRERMASTSKKKPSTAVAELGQKATQLEQAATLKATKAQIKELQLSLFDLAPWADNLRAMPNDLARAALFTVRNKRTPRVARQAHSIFVLSKGVEITYTGIELRADDDELVWQQVLEYAKRVPVGSPVTFTFYELCKDLGWSINGRYYDKAEECLSRLQATALQFISGRIGRLESVSLIHRFRVLDRGKKNSRCQVEIDDEMVVLFAGKYYSKFEWEKYRSLSPTARRMFDYFVSHSEPFPMLLESFRLMCGSDSDRLKKWTEQTNKACEELNGSGLVKKSWVAGDKIYCER